MSKNNALSTKVETSRYTVKQFLNRKGGGGGYKANLTPKTHLETNKILMAETAIGLTLEKKKPCPFSSRGKKSVDLRGNFFYGQTFPVFIR